MKSVRLKWAAALVCLIMVGAILALCAADSRAGQRGTTLARAEENAPFHGNVSSKIFHRAGCRYYNCRKCVAGFATREEALQAGYRPCKVCKP